MTLIPSNSNDGFSLLGPPLPSMLSEPLPSTSILDGAGLGLGLGFDSGLGIGPGPTAPLRPIDPRPTPDFDALPSEVRSVNKAMRLRYETERFNRPGESTSDERRNAEIDPNANIAVKRVELAVALAALVSQAKAEIQDAVHKLKIYNSVEENGSVETERMYDGETATWAKAKKGIIEQTLRIRELNAVIADATRAWEQYQLNDVTLFVDEGSEGIHSWMPIKGIGQAFSAENAGKFLPDEYHVHSAQVLFDTLLLVVPWGRVAKLGAEAAGTVEERLALRTVLAGSGGRNRRRCQQVYFESAPEHLFRRRHAALNAQRREGDRRLQGGRGNSSAGPTTRPALPCGPVSWREFSS